MKTKARILIVVILIVALWLTVNMLYVVDIIDKLPKHPQKRYGIRSMNEISRIIIHHSAVDGQGPNEYAAYHVSQDWPGIGYHYVISPLGQVYQTNSLDTISYHVADHNTQSIGICVSGNLNNHPMTLMQKRRVKQLIRHINREVGRELEVVGHRDLGATDCPGRYTNLTDFV